jgi:hypothetical protein
VLFNPFLRPKPSFNEKKFHSPLLALFTGISHLFGGCNSFSTARGRHHPNFW